jgi:solute carrier family 45 protein 1/2/4
MIWLMGPLAGTFVQPLMGVWSDSVTCRWGRRRPFVIGGSIGLLIGLMVLSGAKELSSLVGISSRVFAIVGVCMVLLFVQPLQMGARALIAEQSPPHLVSQTNGWASRWIGFGSMSGYLLGALNLGDSMKTLYVIAGSLLILSVLVTCWTIQEAPSLDKFRSNSASGKISPAIKQIFKVQFFAWMAWFPFLYYGSTYITEGGSLGLEAFSISRGSFGMFLFASVALCFNITLPHVLSYFEITRGSGKAKRRMPLAILWMIGQLSYSGIMFCALIAEGEGRIVLVALAGFNWSLTQWAPFTLINEHLLDDELDAGIVMSLHNAAISLPQILSALLAGSVLWVLRNLGATDELRILLSLTAVPSLLAAYQAGCIEYER